MLFNCFSSVVLRKFDSGVMVIQNKSHRDEEVSPFYIFVSGHFCIYFRFYRCYFLLKIIILLSNGGHNVDFELCTNCETAGSGWRLVV